MKIGIIGLGRMGNAIAYRLLRSNHEVIGFDTNLQSSQSAQDLGVTIVDSVEKAMGLTRILWLMVPAGKIIDEIIETASANMRHGDIIVDGGNSHFQDSTRRAAYLAERNIYFLDCGTSGGLAGRENGFSLMVGGNKEGFLKIEDLLQAIATPKGYGHVGPSGAGHYVKMVHNGIEYALLQSYAEGFHLLKAGSFQELDLAQIATIWNHGSVIRSWILQLTESILQKDQALQTIDSSIAESGMGLWTVQEAHAHKVPVKLIEDALEIRALSRAGKGTYATTLVALLRNAFGGHAVFKKSGLED